MKTNKNNEFETLLWPLKVVICGGAAELYVDCQEDQRPKGCGRNLECISNTSMCTGPKLQECYGFDDKIQEFKVITQVRVNTFMYS